MNRFDENQYIILIAVHLKLKTIIINNHFYRVDRYTFCKDNTHIHTSSNNNKIITNNNSNIASNLIVFNNNQYSEVYLLPITILVK